MLNFLKPTTKAPFDNHFDWIFYFLTFFLWVSCFLGTRSENLPEFQKQKQVFKNYFLSFQNLGKNLTRKQEI